MAGVTIRVRSDTSQARRELQRLEQSVQNISRRADQVSRSIAAIGAAITVAFGGDALTRASDAFVNMENKVALVVGRTQELDRTLSGLYNVATQTRTTINATTETFNRFGKALGNSVSAEQLLKVTNTVQQALTISGGSAQAAEAAIFQLGQGLASGTLRGQELNSVLEQAPRIAKAIADSLGVAIGDLRGLAEQGKLTTDVVFNALEGQAEAVAKEFELVNGTVGQSITSVGQQITRIIGEFDRSTLAVGSLGIALNAVAKYFNENATSIALSASLIYNNISNVFRGFFEIGKGVVSVVGALLGRLADAAPAIIVPMLVLNDYIFLGLVAGVSKLTTGFLNLLGATDAFVESFLGIGFEGTIYRLFNAGSLIEFGVALQDLGGSIDTLGRRWYNVFNLTERFIRGANVELLRMGIFLGVVDQKILAFRFTSFERLYKILDPIKALVNDIVLAFFGLNIVSTVFIGIVAVLQGFFVTIDAILSVFGVSIRQFLGELGRLDKALEDINPFNLNQTADFFEKYVGVQREGIDSFVDGMKAAQKAWGGLMDGLNSISMFDSVIDRIKKFAKTIERTFFWLYDEIIANSWWTDTMVGVYEKAQEFLSKTLSYISTFAKKVTDLFRFRNLKAIYFDIKLKLSSVDIAAEAQRIVSNAARVFRDLIRTANNAIADVYFSLTSAIPRLGELLAVGISTAFLAIAAPAFMTKFIAVFAAGFAANFSGVITDLFGEAITRSGFFSDLGAAFGRAIGDILNFIIQNTPLILQGLIDFAAAFGEALIDQITGAFAVIPQTLSTLFGGLFNSLVGGAAAATLFSTLIFGFKDTFSTISKLGGEKGLLFKLFMGKGRAIAGVLAAITFINSALGAFTEGGAFAEALISGGLLAYAFLGKEGIQGLLTKVLSSVKAIFTAVSVSAAQQAKSSNLASILNFDDFKKQVSSGKFKDALTSIRSGMDNLRKQIDSGKYGYSFSSAWSRGLNDAKKNTDSVFNNIVNSFEGAGRRAGKTYSKGFGKAAKVGLVAAVATIFAGMSSAAEAAEVSTTAKVNSMLEKIQDNFYELANGALFLLAIFGPGKITGFFAALAGAVKQVILSMNVIRFAALGKSIASGKNVGLIAQLLFGATGRLNKIAITRQVLGFASSIIGPLIRTLGSVALRIAPMLLNPAMWIAGGISILGLILFGEGDTLFQKIDNFFSRIRSALTGTTKEARKLGRELRDVMPQAEVAGQDFSNIVSRVSNLNLNNVNERAFRDLKVSLKSLGKVQDRAAATFEETGENTVIELQQLKRATRDVERAILRASATSDVNVITKALFDQLNPTQVVDEEANALERFFNLNRLIQDTDNPELKKLASIVEAGGANTQQTAVYLRELLNFLNSAGDLTQQQTFQRDLLRNLVPIIGPQSRGAVLEAPEELQNALAATIQEAAIAFAELQRLQNENDDTVVTQAFRELGRKFGILEEAPDLMAEAVKDSILSSLGQQSAAISAINAISKNRQAEQQEFKALTNALNLANSGFGGTNLAFDELTFEQFSILPQSIRSGLKVLSGQVNKELDKAAKEALRQVLSDDGNARLLRQSLERAFGEGATWDQILGPPQFDDFGERIFSDENIQNVFNYLTEAGITAQEIPGLYEILAGENGKDLPRIAGFFNQIGMMLKNFEEDQERAGQGLVERTTGALEGVVSRLGGDTSLVENIDLEIITPDILKKLEDSQKKIDSILADTTKTVTETNTAFNKEANAIADQIIPLVGTLGLYESALDQVDDPIDLTEVVKLDPDKKKQVEDLTSKVLGLGLAIDILRQGGVSGAEGQQILAFENLIKGYQDALQKIIGKPDDKNGDTVFEKFVGSLGESGFSVDIRQAATLGKAAMEGLQAPLKAIEAAQKRIVNSSLMDVAVRKKAIETIKAQKGAILEVFTGGTTEQAEIGLAAFGMDASQVIDERTYNLTKDIIGLKEDLAQTSFHDYEARRLISREIEYQQYLLDGLTTGAQESTNKISDAFSSGFKELLKGEKTIVGFFEGLLDTLSETIIDTVVDSFIAAFLEASSFKSTFDTFFGNLFSFGAGVGTGGGGGGRYQGGVIQNRNMGGLVNPNIGQAGKDSVPVMLTPGEYVLPSKRTADLFKQQGANAGGQTVVNLSITGDISRQTRTEIVKMLPTIASGVNAQNKERNYKYR